MQGEFLCEIQIKYNHDIRTIFIQSAFKCKIIPTLAKKYMSKICMNFKSNASSNSVSFRLQNYKDACAFIIYACIPGSFSTYQNAHGYICNLPSFYVLKFPNDHASLQLQSLNTAPIRNLP